MCLRRLFLVVAMLAAGEASASIQVSLVANGIPNLVDIEHAGDGRLFLVDQDGRILIHSGTAVLATPFLDIREIVLFDGEQGLLGLAFHPNYAANGFFYVNYTDHSGDIVVARYRAAPPGGNVADPASATVVLNVPHPTNSNHNGGQIRFGPDGYLYVATGDGGGGGDQANNAQNLDSLLGKILRLDIDGAVPYAVPPTNPFVKTANARPEIWSYGLRNPWRFTFDRQTGDMFIADVGQGLWEEINFEPAATGGRNYGWRRMEGTHCFNPSSNCSAGTLVLPMAEYPHSVGCSVTGGFRYRGVAIPEHTGTYFFADYCSGRIWGAAPSGDGSWIAVQLLDTDFVIPTFGEDAAGNLYVGNHGNGGLYRLTAASTPRLTIGKTGTGTGLVESSGAAIYCGTICGVEANGTTFTLIVTPAAGTVFNGWSGDPDCLDGSVTLTSNRTCIAQLSVPGAFTDETLTPGVTPVRAVHFAELRTRIDAQRVRFKLQAFRWTDPSLSAGSTPIRTAHVLELRRALAEAYSAAGRALPQYTDTDITSGSLVRAVHITELRAAVRALE
jgi:glucose/arabinose dehydrogenase